MTCIFRKSEKLDAGPTCFFHAETYKHLIYGSFKSAEHPQICQLTFIYYQFSLVWTEVTPSVILHIHITIFTIIYLYSFSLCKVLMFLSNPFLPSASLHFLSPSLPFIFYTKFLLTWWLLSNPFVLTLDFELCHKCFIDPFSLPKKKSILGFPNPFDCWTQPFDFNRDMRNKGYISNVQYVTKISGFWQDQFSHYSIGSNNWVNFNWIHQRNIPKLLMQCAAFARRTCTLSGIYAAHE